MTTLSPETIKKAVEIAPDWEVGKEGEDEVVYYIGQNGYWWFSHLPQVALDALAAALVRVVDDVDKYVTYSFPKATEIHEKRDTVAMSEIIPEVLHRLVTVEGSDRTANTINAIVELSDKHPEVFSSE